MLLSSAIIEDTSMSLLKPSEAAAFLRLSQRTLERLRLSGGGPRYCKLKRSVRYRLSDLEAWLSLRSVGSTSEVGR
jgi:predicted DNA-binding transcriptional regulator AlpA